MDEITDALAAAMASARSAVTAGAIPGLSDADLLTTMARAEELGRTVDALRVAMAAEVAERSRPSLGGERLSARQGCRTPFELIARVTGVSERTAVQRCRLGERLRRRETLAGEILPPQVPIVAAAFAAGRLGIDAATVIVNTMTSTGGRADPGLLSEAEHALVASALGIDDATGEQWVPFTADQTRIQAIQWQVALDPDGAEPRERRAMVERGFTRLGKRGDLTRYRLDAIPELAGKLERLMDAYLSPKVTAVFLTEEERRDADLHGDARNGAQQRHDILMAVVDSAARAAETPTLGGASPTVLVSVSADDLERGTGAGWIDGVEEPLSIGAVMQFICTGGIQKGYFDPDGRLTALGSPERCFTPQQRRGIALRDGGCVIPGCGIPAGWCEIHHVQEHSQGGPTHTDNGVMLCWFHHRTLETSGWQVAMQNGVPHIRPPVWIDPRRPWRRADPSRTNRLRLTRTRTGTRTARAPDRAGV
jgi:5-methylcytosine-specific restriction protein A